MKNNILILNKLRNSRLQWTGECEVLAVLADGDYKRVHKGTWEQCKGFINQNSWRVFA